MMRSSPLRLVAGAVLLCATPPVWFIIAVVNPSHYVITGGIAVWIARVEFVGCNGLEVNEPMRLMIAAQACIPALRLEHDVFARLFGVLLYPDESWVEESGVDEGTGVVAEGGPVCRCGNRGCLETLASTRAITDLLTMSRGEEISTRRLLERAFGDRLR